MSNSLVDGGIPTTNGVHPSESNEKVTTIPNPENDQPAVSEQSQLQDMISGDNGQERPQMPDRDFDSSISTSNADFDDLMLSTNGTSNGKLNGVLNGFANGSAKSYAAVAAEADENDGKNEGLDDLDRSYADVVADRDAKDNGGDDDWTYPNLPITAQSQDLRSRVGVLEEFASRLYECP